MSENAPATVDAADATPAVDQPSQAQNMVQVIERAANNPDVDIDKMERLLDMQERIHAREAEAAFNAALSAVQNELPAIKERGAIKDKSQRTQSTYALWEDINAAIKPILQKHGFALTFKTHTDANHVSVEGILTHEKGHRESTTLPLPVDSSGSKNAVQAVASSVSYGKRYTAASLLNITTHGDDDDGAAAGAPATITPEQAGHIEELIKETHSDRGRFLKWVGVETLDQIKTKHYENVVQALENKRKKQEQA